ncbi:MAG: phosphatase PAP2 family protein [Clostridia bacterium]
MENSGSFKKRTIISVALFVLAFVGLILIASFHDFKISQILTKNSLPSGQYISNNGFGLLFEAIGSSPIYIMSGIACTIWFWWAIRKNKMWLAVIAAILVIVANFVFFSDIFKYVGRHFAASISGVVESEGFFASPYIKTIEVMMSIMLSGLLIVSWGWIKPETNDKLVKWSFIIFAVLACYLVIHFVKGPVGRMRYRAMNVTGDWNAFTNWYVLNGKRAIEGLPDDCCKSFPSGHTYSAAAIYSLLCLPAILESWNKRWIKVTLFTVTIGYTGIVAISRLIVGAHFMSDVLIGGTLAFLVVMIAREVFIYKGAHIKIFKS